MPELASSTPAPAQSPVMFASIGDTSIGNQMPDTADVIKDMASKGLDLAGKGAKVAGRGIASASAGGWNWASGNNIRAKHAQALDETVQEHGIEKALLDKQQISDIRRKAGFKARSSMALGASAISHRSADQDGLANNIIQEAAILGARNFAAGQSGVTDSNPLTDKQLQELLDKADGKLNPNTRAGSFVKAGAVGLGGAIGGGLLGFGVAAMKTSFKGAKMGAKGGILTGMLTGAAIGFFTPVPGGLLAGALMGAVGGLAVGTTAGAVGLPLAAGAVGAAAGAWGGSKLVKGAHSYKNSREMTELKKAVTLAAKQGRGQAEKGKVNFTTTPVPGQGVEPAAAVAAESAAMQYKFDEAGKASEKGNAAAQGNPALADLLQTNLLAASPEQGLKAIVKAANEMEAKEGGSFFKAIGLEGKDAMAKWNALDEKQMVTFLAAQQTRSQGNAEELYNQVKNGDVTLASLRSESKIIPNEVKALADQVGVKVQPTEVLPVMDAAKQHSLDEAMKAFEGQNKPKAVAQDAGAPLTPGNSPNGKPVPKTPDGMILN